MGGRLLTVSMKFTPAWIQFPASAPMACFRRPTMTSKVPPTPPNVIGRRQTRKTKTPTLPKCPYSIDFYSEGSNDLIADKAMGLFTFQSRTGASASPLEWLTKWSARFDSAKYPEDVYQELVARATKLSDADFDVLGAWKDGALRKYDAIRHSAKVDFGNCRVSLTKAWSPTAASCAYRVWKKLLQHRAELEQHLDRGAFFAFLDQLAQLSYEKASGSGRTDASFGLSRATYVLHLLSGAKFPIYDKNTHLGIHFLTQGRYDSHTIKKMKTDDPRWYLATFCPIVRTLEEVCAVRDLPSQRALDKALFCYGKRR